jgi:predicted RecA/RadA family phage recombinase
MANNYIQPGDVVTYTNSTGEAIQAGDLVPLVNRSGVALVDIADGSSGSVQVVGVFTVEKTTGATWSIGQALYVSSSTGKATTVSAGNVPAGFAFADAGSSAATGQLLLGGQLAMGAAGAVAALTGTLTGTVDGTLADVAAIAIDTSDTYADTAVNTAVNTAITSVNLQLKELQTTLNAVIAALKAAGLMASS